MEKQKRLAYLLAFALLLVVEVCIALFVHDAFVRPYVGDVLVTVLLCCLCRVIRPRFAPALPVFLLAAAVEGLQWLGLTEIMGLQETILGIIMGSTFDWKDILCYGLGCLLFTGVELLWSNHTKHHIKLKNAPLGER